MLFHLPFICYFCSMYFSKEDVGRSSTQGDRLVLSSWMPSPVLQIQMSPSRLIEPCLQLWSHFCMVRCVQASYSCMSPSEWMLPPFTCLPVKSTHSGNPEYTNRTDAPSWRRGRRAKRPVPVSSSLSPFSLPKTSCIRMAERKLHCIFTDLTCQGRFRLDNRKNSFSRSG